MIAKMISITIVYPLIRLKILSQSMVGSKSMGFQRAMEMIQKHGIVSLYQGLLYQLARSMLAAGVMFATQEHLRNILKRMHDVPKTPAHYIEEDA